MDIHIFLNIAIITFEKAFISSTTQVCYRPSGVTIMKKIIS